MVAGRAKRGQGLVVIKHAPELEAAYRFNSYALILRSSVERSMLRMAAAWLLFQSVCSSVRRMCSFSMSSSDNDWYSAGATFSGRGPEAYSDDSQMSGASIIGPVPSATARSTTVRSSRTLQGTWFPYRL